MFLFLDSPNKLHRSISDALGIEQGILVQSLFSSILPINIKLTYLLTYLSIKLCKNYATGIPFCISIFLLYFNRLCFHDFFS